MYGIWIYRKQSEDIEAITDTIGKLRNMPCSTCTIYTDLPDSRIAWHAMKKEIEGSHGYLYLTSLQAAGDTPGEAARELIWLSRQNFLTKIMDCPSTLAAADHTANAAALLGITDALNLFPDRTAFGQAHTGKGGRPRIHYPDNWEDLFAEWTAGNITASYFMKSCGLKKGTFYHLIQEYKTSLEIFREIQNIPQK